MNRIRLSAALTAAAVAVSMLTACSGGDSSETDTEPVNIISDGTQYEEEPQMPSLSDYVPNSDEYSDWETRYGYFQLDDSQREMYDATVSALKNYSQSMPLFADSQTYSRILYLIAIEQMSVFYLKQATPTLNESGRYFDVEFSYSYPSAQSEEMNNLAAAEAENIISQIPDGADDYEKLKFIHDWLVLNVEKDTESPLSSTVYGTLIKKKALCEGYAKSFSYMCNRLGIENIIVTGYTDVPHMWNMVRLDGDWYHVDVTWDDVSMDLEDFVSYQFFLADDRIVMENRTIDRTIYVPPKAGGTKYNYFVHEGFLAEASADYPEVLKQSIIQAVENGRDYAMIKLGSAQEYVYFLNEINARSDGIDKAIYLANKELAEKNITVNITSRFNADAYQTAVFILDVY